MPGDKETARSPPAQQGHRQLRSLRSTGRAVQIATRPSPPPAALHPGAARGVLLAAGAGAPACTDAMWHERQVEPRNLTSELLVALQRDSAAIPGSPAASTSSLGNSSHEQARAAERGSAGSRCDSTDRIASGSGTTMIEWRHPVEEDATDAAPARWRAETSAESLAAALRSSALLEPLASVDVDRLATELDFLAYSRGERIVQQGNPCIDGMYFFFKGRAHAIKASITDGSTKVLRTFAAESRRGRVEDGDANDDTGSMDGLDGGSERNLWGPYAITQEGESALPTPPHTTNLWKYEAADYFGEFALWKQQPVSYSVDCDTDCLVVRIRGEVLQKLAVFEDVVLQLHAVGNNLSASRLRLQFESFDSDKDGLLTLHEASALFKALGCGSEYSFSEFEIGFPRLESAWVDALSYEDFFAFWDTCNFDDPFKLRTMTTSALDELSGHEDLQRRKIVNDDDSVVGTDLRAQSSVRTRDEISSHHLHMPTKQTPPAIPQHQSDLESRILDSEITDVTGPHQAIASFTDVINDMSATREDKLTALKALKNMNYSVQNHKCGIISQAILQNKSGLHAILQTMGSNTEDPEVRQAAADVIQACLQASDTASEILLERELESQANECSKSREEWRASFLSTTQPGFATNVPRQEPLFSSFHDRCAAGPKQVSVNSSIGPDRQSPSTENRSPSDISNRGRDSASEPLRLKRGRPSEKRLRDASNSTSPHGSGRTLLRNRSISPSNVCGSLSPGYRRRHRISASPTRSKITDSDLQRFQVSKYLSSVEDDIERQDPRKRFEANWKKFESFLMTVPDFKELDVHQREKLASIVSVRIYKLGDVICEVDVRGRTHFFVMYKGSAVSLNDEDAVNVSNGSLDATRLMAKYRYTAYRNHCGSERKRSTNQESDALSDESGRHIVQGDVFGWESVALAYHANTMVKEHRTCLAASQLCTVLCIPYEAYEKLLQGLAIEDVVMNNLQDREDQIKAAFTKLDLDGNGVLDTGEIARLCEYVGIPSGQSIVEQLCSMIGRKDTTGENYEVTLYQFSKWWEGLNVFHVEQDIVAQQAEEEIERKRVQMQREKFDRERERERLAEEDKGPSPEPVTVVYDMDGRKHTLPGKQTSSCNLPSLQEVLPRKAENRPQHDATATNSWRAFLRPPDPEKWAGMLEHGHLRTARSDSPTKQRGSPLVSRAKRSSKGKGPAHVLVSSKQSCHPMPERSVQGQSPMSIMNSPLAFPEWMGRSPMNTPVTTPLRASYLERSSPIKASGLSADSRPVGRTESRSVSPATNEPIGPVRGSRPSRTFIKSDEGLSRRTRSRSASPTGRFPGGLSAKRASRKNSRNTVRQGNMGATGEIAFPFPDLIDDDDDTDSILVPEVASRFKHSYVPSPRSVGRPAPSPLLLTTLTRRMNELKILRTPRRWVESSPGLYRKMPTAAVSGRTPR